VHGPIFDDIKRGVDLTADILPPPLYVIEFVPDTAQAAGHRVA
jgi:hypothetical protein